MWYDELISLLESLGMVKSKEDFHFSIYDMYDAEKHIGVKFYSIYEHCSMSNCFETIPSNAHFIAFRDALESGDHLISIFEHDWIRKKDKIISLFTDIYKSIPIYARKLSISTVSSKIKRSFINQFHLSGDSAQGSIAYGLYDGDQLISVMTFGKLRGQSHSEYERSYELSRFVTKSGYRIVGGASKLFSAFVKEYNPEYIICYSDNDFFTGNTYDKLGFCLLDLGRSVDYNWISYDPETKELTVLSRQQCQPWRLRTQYPDIMKDFPGGSQEDFCMLSLGYNKFFRSGNSRREWKRK